MGEQPTAETSATATAPDTGSPEEVEDRRGIATADEIPAAELARLLNDAFAVELARKRASLGVEPALHDPDAGTRFLKGLFLAGAVGIAAWGAILLLLLALL